MVAGAVAKAGMESGVAERPLDDFDAYVAKLNASVYRSSMVMRPVFEQSGSQSRKIVFAEGEDERVLRAAVAVVEETVDRPILIGRPDVIYQRCARYGLPKPIVEQFDIVDPTNVVE